MECSLFDLHCDTAYLMRRNAQPLKKNNLAVSLDGAKKFKKYIQVMAIWTDKDLSDEDGFSAFLDIRKNLIADPSVQNGDAAIATDFQGLCAENPSLILAVEDARILAGDLARVDLLAGMGVRIVTPLWGGETCIGGSHDTNYGLTAFGKEAVARLLSHGIVPDISHASIASAEEILELASSSKMPVIASHSNAYGVCPVSRNLFDDQVKSILASDGLIGLNLYRNFLSEHPPVSMESLLPHIDRFLSLGAEDHLALGGDMDGADLPEDLQTVGEYEKLAELLLQRNYPEELVRKIFFDNAFGFAKKYLFKPTKG